MHKIYSRPRIRIPKVLINGEVLNNHKNKKIAKIIIILIIAFSTVKIVLDAVYPIFDTLCEAKAKSIATIVSNEQATTITYDYNYLVNDVFDEYYNTNIFNPCCETAISLTWKKIIIII